MPEIRQNGKKPSAVDSGKLADQLKMRLRRNFVNEVASATSKMRRTTPRLLTIAGFQARENAHRPNAKLELQIV